MAGGIINAIGRFLGYVVIDILLEIIFYWIGKISLRILTLGRYPPRQEEKHCEGCVQAFGLTIFVVVAVGPFLVKSV